MVFSFRVPDVCLWSVTPRFGQNFYKITVAQYGLAAQHRLHRLLPLLDKKADNRVASVG